MGEGGVGVVVVGVVVVKVVVKVVLLLLLMVAIAAVFVVDAPPPLPPRVLSQTSPSTASAMIKPCSFLSGVRAPRNRCI